MKVVGILGCAFAMAAATACGPGDPPESIHFGPGSPGPGRTGAGGGDSRGGSDGAAGGVSTPKSPEVGTFAEEVVEADPAPLPIAGGTLAIIAQGARAAIADPDHDQVVVIDLASMSIATTIPLAAGDDPGRLVEDAAGRLHVALRAGRGVAVLDPSSRGAFARLSVCPLPRGLAYDYDSDTVHVACAGGELVSYTASSGQQVRKLRLDRDLRDVVVDGERLLVSRFRAAQLLVVEGNGTISARLSPPVTIDPNQGMTMKAAVAWRTIAAPGGGALMVHQRMAGGPIDTKEGGYGGVHCRRILTTSVSMLRSDKTGWYVDSIPTVLPVDVATSADGKRIAVPSAARTSSMNFSAALPYAVFNTPELNSRTNLTACGGAFPMPPFVDGAPEPQGRVVAVAFDPSGRFALQTRGPAMFHLGDRAVALPGRPRKHTGHELFHLATASGAACASCHPGGGEDGQIWNFAQFGLRRTQSLAGGVSGTEPFHWSGDMSDFNKLITDVFSSRMSGPHVELGHVASLKNWVDRIPRMEALEATDSAAAARGQTLFNDTKIGCANCHNGARFTNNASLNVNTGGYFQVPSLLGLAWREPYMHTGCAATLADRFGPCGGGDAHGATSALTAAQKADLVAYMETL
jgi:hypothetical protein